MFEDNVTPEISRVSLLDRAWSVAEKVSPGVSQLRETFRVAKEGSEKTGMPLVQAFAVTLLANEQMNQILSAAPSSTSAEKLLNHAQNLGKDVLHTLFPNKVGVCTATGAFAGGVLLSAADAIVTGSPSLIKSGLYMAAGASIGNQFE
jgi:hypothetical protein